MSTDSRWWDPRHHADRRPVLLARNRMIAAIRAWFAERDFIEVETPALQVSPGNEPHLHPFSTEIVSTDGRRAELHLHTSPEFVCKKLLAAGEARLFTLARVFRNRERTCLHHPEFTMLEWYRAEDSYETLKDDCTALLAVVARAAAVDRFTWHGCSRCDASADPFAAPERLTVVDAFARYAGIDLCATLDGSEGNRDALAEAATASGVRVADDDTWSDIFTRIMAEKIEPNLGFGRATILTDYPVAEAALARTKPSAPWLAERFELYVCGVELANAFGELTDPAEQRRRFVRDMAEKARRYGTKAPIDEDFLAALAVMPQAAGIALGLDRMVMLATGAPHIEHVLWAPVADVLGGQSD
ncbi:MAG: EF-P lysine aminoacylase GenX [Blastochloris sp.]|nr:EF-P lysine aminoacylase GenX [Blastochloris sp.]